MDNQKILMAYGKNYAVAFEFLQYSGEAHAREKAAEAGKRAIHYLAQAKAFEDLSDVTNTLVNSTLNPYLLQPVINELTQLLEKTDIPQEIHLSLQIDLADALRNIEQSEKALLVYQQALAETKTEQHWQEISWIYQGIANALFSLGKLSQAREMYLSSAKQKKANNNPVIDIINSELYALRIDVMQNKVAQASLQLEQILITLRKWWQCYKNEGFVAECPNTYFLSRTLIAALDIAIQINDSLEHWKVSLKLNNEIAEILQMYGESVHGLALNSLNRCNYLINNGKLEEARRGLDACLQVFRQTDDMFHQAMVLSALSLVWDKRNDLSQAIALQYQALTLFEQLADPYRCSILHGNLSENLYLQRKIEEASKHGIAKLVYNIVTENLLDIESALIIFFHKQNIINHNDLPRLNDILILPEFNALHNFLKKNGINSDEVQTRIDELEKDFHDNYFILNEPYQAQGNDNYLNQKDSCHILKIRLNESINTNDLEQQATVLVDLAEFWDKHDIEQAINWMRQALAVEKKLGIPKYCAEAHGKLGMYLYKDEQKNEGNKHTLAELTYDIVSDNWEGIESDLQRITSFIQDSAKTSTDYKLPQLTELLNDSTFDVLCSFLQERQVDIKEVQTKIDILVRHRRYGLS